MTYTSMDIDDPHYYSIFNIIEKRIHKSNNRFFSIISVKPIRDELLKKLMEKTFVTNGIFYCPRHNHITFEFTDKPQKTIVIYLYDLKSDIRFINNKSEFYFIHTSFDSSVVFDSNSTIYMFLDKLMKTTTKEVYIHFPKFEFIKGVIYIDQIMSFHGLGDNLPVFLNEK